MLKKICYVIPMMAIACLVSFNSIALEEEDDSGDGVKQQWYRHDCELGSQSGVLSECRINSSSEKCGKPQKNKPFGDC